jgi:hypothetical protein
VQGPLGEIGAVQVEQIKGDERQPGRLARDCRAQRAERDAAQLIVSVSMIMCPITTFFVGSSTSLN